MDLKDFDFYFAIGFLAYGIPKEIGSFQVNKVQMTRYVDEEDGQVKRGWESTPIEIVQCNKYLKNGDFPLKKLKSDKPMTEDEIAFEEALTKDKYSQLMCPSQTDTTNFNLTGDFYEADFQFVELRLMTCQKEDYCASDKEKKNFFEQNAMQFIITDSYTDPLEPGSPLKYYSMDKYFKYMTPNFYQQTNFFFSPLKLEQSYLFQDTSINSYKYSYQQDFITARETDTDKDFWTGYLRIDTKSIIVKRQEYSVSQLLADLGGIAKTIAFVFGALTLAVTRKTFMIEMVQDLFKIRRSVFSNGGEKRKDILSEILPDGNINSSGSDDNPENHPDG